MRKKDVDFWKTAEDWSRRKHLILSYYLKPASAKLRSVSPDGRVIVIDGYAGRGKYTDGSAGSPIHMGQLANDCKQWRNPVQLKILNVEPQKQSFDELENCTRRWVEEGTMSNVRSTFKNALPSMLEEANSSPLFAFLDPFRPSHLLFQDFLPLLHRRYPTEICIVLHTPLLLRMIRAVATEKQNAQAQDKSIETLNDVFGGDCWMKLMNASTINPKDVVECFGDELAMKSKDRLPFICIHPIEARYGVNLKYHVVFFTRHREGVKLMNDAFCEELQMSYSTATRSSQITFDLGFENQPAIEMDQIQRTDFLAKAILKIATDSSNQPLKRSELIFHSMLENFGQFSETEHRQAIQSLADKDLTPRLKPLDGVWLKGVKRWRLNENTHFEFEG